LLRQEGSERLAKRLEEEVQRMETMLASEKKAREQTENALFRMLEDIGNKLTTEIKVLKFFIGKIYK